MLTEGWIHLRRNLIIKWVGWPILWINWPLFPVTLVMANAFMNNMVLYSGPWTSLHQGWCGCSYCWVLNLPTTKANTEPLIWHHSSGGWCGRSVTSDYFHQGRESILILATYLIQICLPCLQLFYQTTIYWLTGCLIHLQGVPNSLTSNQRTNFLANEVQKWNHVHQIHGIHWYYNVPQHPEAASLAGWWNGLLKTQL